MALVEHRPGVLQRVASLFSRRGFNIDSITVGATDDPKVARMTIITIGDDKILEQVTKQMNKLVDVIKIKDLDRENSVCREMCLVKVQTPDETRRSEMIQYVEVFRGKIVDVSKGTTTAELTGDSDKVNAFINLMRGIGIKEISRTGITAMQRGS